MTDDVVVTVAGSRWTEKTIRERSARRERAREHDQGDRIIIALLDALLEARRGITQLQAVISTRDQAIARLDDALLEARRDSTKWFNQHWDVCLRAQQAERERDRLRETVEWYESGCPVILAPLTPTPPPEADHA